jgi:hypothetical protein
MKVRKVFLSTPNTSAASSTVDMTAAHWLTIFNVASSAMSLRGRPPLFLGAIVADGWESGGLTTLVIWLMAF